MVDWACRGQRWLSLPEGMYRAITPEEAVKMPEEDREQAEQERVETALDMISEMSVTGEQLRMMRGSLSRVPAAALFGNSQETLDKITSDVISVSDALAKRVEKEIALSKGNVDAEQVRGRVLSRLGLLGKGARSDSRVEGSPMK